MDECFSSLLEDGITIAQSPSEDSAAIMCMAAMWAPAEMH